MSLGNSDSLKFGIERGSVVPSFFKTIKIMNVTNLKRGWCSQENTVYRTNDLSVFTQIKGNRPPNPKHIRRLKDSIEKNGVLQNPIIVNEDLIIIDGQHRLMAAKQAKSDIYFMIVNGYDLEEVQILNLNQKNWTKKDFLYGYADMGIESYVKLKKFMEKNSEFNISDCIAMCSNNASSGSKSISQKYNNRVNNQVSDLKEVFEEGTWKGKDFVLAQENADKIKMLKDYYSGYNRTSFVSAVLGIIKKEGFDFIEFLNKVKIQPSALKDCASITQYKMLIEDIYNYRRREKVNLRY